MAPKLVRSKSYANLPVTPIEEQERSKILAPEFSGLSMGGDDNKEAPTDDGNKKAPRDDKDKEAPTNEAEGPCPEEAKDGGTSTEETQKSDKKAAEGAMKALEENLEAVKVPPVDDVTTVTEQQAPMEVGTSSEHKNEHKHDRSSDHEDKDASKKPRVDDDQERKA